MRDIAAWKWVRQYLLSVLFALLRVETSWVESSPAGQFCQTLSDLVTRSEGHKSFIQSFLPFLCCIFARFTAKAHCEASAHVVYSLNIVCWKKTLPQKVISVLDHHLTRSPLCDLRGHAHTYRHALVRREHLFLSCRWRPHPPSSWQPSVTSEPPLPLQLFVRRMMGNLI